MDDFLDILAELLCNLNFFNGFRDIRKKTESKFLRGILYLLHGTAVLLLASVTAGVIFLLYRMTASLLGLM